MENNKDTVDVVNPRNKTPRIQSTKGSTRSKVECMVATEKDKISSGSRERKKNLAQYLNLFFHVYGELFLLPSSKFLHLQLATQVQKPLCNVPN